MMRKNLYTLLCAILLPFCLQAQTVTVSFKPGPAVGEDVEIAMLDNNCMPKGQPTWAGVNFGNGGTLRIMAWTWFSFGCNTGEFRALLRFSELSTIPASATINSATLVLKTAPTGMDQGNSIYPGTPRTLPNPGWLKRVMPGTANNWDEQTITWNSAQSITTDPNAANWVTIPVTNCYLDCTLTLDVTDIVRDIFTDRANNVPDANNGFYLQLQNNVHYRSQTWASSDYADSTYWPELIVNYVGCLDSLGVKATPNPICAGEDVQLSAIQVPGADYHWTGPNGYSSTVDSPLLQNLRPQETGDYILEVSNYGADCHTFDTVHVQVNPIPVVDLGPDTSVCNISSLTLQSRHNHTNASYLWSTQAATPSIKVHQTGRYGLTVTENGCTGSDSILVTFDTLLVDLGNDTVLCEGQSIILNSSIPYSLHPAFQWNTGATTSSIRVSNGGLYRLSVTDEGCTGSDSITVITPKLQQHLGDDLLLCKEDPIDITLSANVPKGAGALWNTGETTPDIHVSQAGTYWVNVSYPPCSGSDTITINTRRCDCEVFVPNAFTPNGDGLNDELEPKFDPGCPVQRYNFQVYNRYGQLVYKSNKQGEAWDGTYLNGKPADAGTYMYLLTYGTLLHSESKVKRGDITLMR